jgi:ATP-dependent Lhr-like helicase
LGAPTAPQREGWPAIRAGRHVLISAPTGSGKTLAAFLSAIDALVKEASALPDETRVLYVSPLKALGNDVQKNLAAPLAELRERDPSLPEVRVLVRSGDTPQSERAGMTKRPPHILVTTPESLYILLTSEGGRKLLGTVRSVIVDEIHAVLGDKRGSHLRSRSSACRLWVERAQGREPQRIGLSATQKPLSAVADFLGGGGRAVTMVDQGSIRELDLAIELPPSPLEPVCSHETWGEIYKRVSELVLEHKTTLVFVQTRKLAERVAAQLAALLGEARVTCHHSSLAKERRLAAEQRLKSGELAALVATASLELGIDIGDVDLVCQLGTPRSIAMFLQRVGRAGHGVGRTPKGRLFPLTPDELVEAAALFRALKHGVLDRTPSPRPALDVLAQADRGRMRERALEHGRALRALPRLVAVPRARTSRLRRARGAPRAGPRRAPARGRRERPPARHAPRALDRDHLRRRDPRLDPVPGRARARGHADRLARRGLRDRVERGRRVPARQRHRGASCASSAGCCAWSTPRARRPRCRSGSPRRPRARASSRRGQRGARARRGRRLARARDRHRRAGGARARAYLAEARDALGAMPTRTRLVLERFFDESGGAQLVLHAPLGGRINKALGLVLRKRFCRHFGFELQAAAGEDHVLLSLSPQHSFPLEEVFDYVRSDRSRGAARAGRARRAAVRSRAGAGTLSARSCVERFQAASASRRRSCACAPTIAREGLPRRRGVRREPAPGDIAIPWEHPLVRQTLRDCTEEAMDADGPGRALRGLEDGAIERVAVDTVQPSPSRAPRSLAALRLPRRRPDRGAPHAGGALAARARRAHGGDARRARSGGDRGGEGRGVAGPARRRGGARGARVDGLRDRRGGARPGRRGSSELARAGRVVREGERCFASRPRASRRPCCAGAWRRSGPMRERRSASARARARGRVLRIPYEGARGWCERRLLARIQRYTLDALRREIAPVPTAEFLRYLAAWQHVEPDFRGEGPAG